jgi:GH24 family phage-related lysozyme (muramidase)
MIGANVEARVRDTLMGHEGLVLRAYDDATGRVIQPHTTVKGFVSIGYGRNLIGRGITQPEADHLLSNDMHVVEQELDHYFPRWRTWSEPRQWAIFELGYNMGVARFNSAWPNTAIAIRAERFTEVAAVLSGSLWRRQVGDSRALPIIRAIHRGAWT